jgi:hypothetical protein
MAQIRDLEPKFGVMAQPTVRLILDGLSAVTLPGR